MTKMAAALVGAALVAGPASAAMLATGDAFPAWSLTDNTGRTVSSRDLAGKTYLLWYFPKAMTSGCTKEGCTLRDNFEGFTKADVVVMGVSYDSPKTNAEFVAKNHFPFKLLSDTDHALAKEVGANSALGIVARRISYLVGPDGRVIKAYDDVQPAEHARQVLDDLAALAAKR